MSLPQPYYSDERVTLFHADCRDLLPFLPKVDLVLTDPPYPDYYADEYKYEDGLIDFLKDMECRQLVFWSAKADFPLDYTAIHIWDKKTGCGSEYERIFDRHGGKNWKMFRYYLINSTLAASWQHDIFTGHKSQKPIALMLDLVKFGKSNLILDPFAGSCTTLVAAKQLGRKSIGIELSEKYCEIGAKRLSQEELFS